MVQLGNCRSARLLGRKRALQRSRWKCQGSEKRCELHRAAGEGERNEREQSTLEALASEVEQMAEGSGIFLVGMMGSGKSTIASELAYALNYSKLDSDDVIEQVAQKSISQIFSDDGEDAFRQLETSVLQELTAFKRTVLSTGGGTAYHPNNWMHLQNGVVVFLDVHVDRLAERVLADGAADTRPMLESADPGESEEECALNPGSASAEHNNSSLLLICVSVCLRY